MYESDHGCSVRNVNESLTPPHMAIYGILLGLTKYKERLDFW